MVQHDEDNDKLFGVATQTYICFEKLIIRTKEVLEKFRIVVGIACLVSGLHIRFPVQPM